MKARDREAINRQGLTLFNFCARGPDFDCDRGNKFITLPTPWAYRSPADPFGIGSSPPQRRATGVRSAGRIFAPLPAGNGILVAFVRP